ncbi:MAG: transposase [Chthoniobacter sp.]
MRGLPDQSQGWQSLLHAQGAQRREDGLRDAWAFADALRVDGQGWKQLQSVDPLVAELRLLCRDELALLEERTALVNQLRKALAEYYPVALEAFEDWTAPSSWRFVQRFPTPAVLAKAGQRQWEKFLHAHRLYRPERAAQRLTLFAQALEFTAGDSITAAKSRLAQTRVRQLLLLQRELDAYREKIRIALCQPSRPRPLRLVARRWGQAGPAAARRDRAGPDGVRGCASSAMLCRQRADQLPIRSTAQDAHAAGLQHHAAVHGPSLGRSQPQAVQLGAGLLQSRARSRQDPRVRPCAASASAG